MQNVSRRSVLLGGGALGALGLIAAATPAWAWEPTGSRAGGGAGVDPALVWVGEGGTPGRCSPGGWPPSTGRAPSIFPV